MLILYRLKCNREQPCSSCTQRGLGTSCTYSANTEISPRVQKGQAPKKPDSLQDRIQQLEDLVIELMNKTPKVTAASKDLQPTGFPGEDIPDDSSTISDTSVIQPSDTGANYVNSEHWAAILDSISELKECFDQEKTEQPVQLISHSLPTDLSGPPLLFGCSRPPEIGDILTSIPPRPVVDRLVSQYFNSFEISAAIVHSIQFLEEVSLDSSLPTPNLVTTADIYMKARASMGLDLETMIATFRLRTAQCLVLGRYTKGGPYVLETLMLYFANEHFLLNDAEINVWIVLSITIQIAIHTGYHKDPKHFKNMSPFTSEMRRRVWATIIEIDLGISAQMGVPRLIKPAQVDTEEPCNLLDSDFDRNTESIPPSRPESDLTPYALSYCKGPTNVLFRHHLGLGYQCQVAFLFLKGIYWRAKVVLHRKFLGRKYPYSREACLNAAFNLLDYQHMLDRETQPFGQLYQDRWKVSSIVNHDFLLAASLLCSYLQELDDPSLRSEDCSEADKITTYLTRSREIWTRSSNASKEARKVVKALNIILRNHTGGNSAPSPTDSASYGLESLAGFTDQYSYGNDYGLETGLSPPFTDISTMGHLAFLFEDPTANL
ncbi:hypothetical protein O1611_g2641 [Lasiodiplodia mahajangana]|uniref:Uncharacterized protein n=1 Tax=Lasiodiplodia mahajangana TaxID=1108764 RepID=A0ACC2JUB5_9PEZI|nr:hypothetical protein O1611_g2641 [Lasiodiplodia mahajangana]